MRKLAWISHPLCEQHDSGDGHPERPARIGAVEQALEESGHASAFRMIEAPAVERAHLERVHAPAHVARMLESAPFHGTIHLDADTVIGPYSIQAALRAAGAVVHAVDLVAAGELDAAFCNVRPPGHHAERARAMGFCVFGNVAVGAAHALEAHGLERVAVIDFDVHHGNGTEDLLRDEERVLFCSSFQHPFYPYSGAETVSDHILNVPLPAGTDGPTWREAVSAAWFEALADFGPELVFFSAGFDAHVTDPLAQLQLHAEDFAWITGEVLRVTQPTARGRAVSALEGGYALAALGRSVVAHVGALLDG
ncbi:MAG: histone deacetylase family protein [Planctomycetota bacterium]|nr:histone deacetylase family protein [Planctomycetota bacterium]